jgi:hypothetical protein
VQAPLGQPARLPEALRQLLDGFNCEEFAQLRPSNCACDFIHDGIS